MNWRDMPPLAALRAFSAFAQTGSVVQAGAALNVSHAAISQQLRGLERHLGLALFDRSGRALVLTPAGDQLAQALGQGFATIAGALQDLADQDSDRPIHVTTTPTFAAKWLVPRLPDFHAAHPRVNLMIDPTPKLVDPATGGVDLALRYGRKQWPGLDSELMFTTDLVVVAAPSLLQGRRIEAPSDLTGLPWLEELGVTEASNWFRTMGVSAKLSQGRIQLPGNLLLDAARDGQGVAVTVSHFIERDIASGRLIVLFSEKAGGGYYIVTRPGVMRPMLRTFVTWLRRQL